MSPEKQRKQTLKDANTFVGGVWLEWGPPPPGFTYPTRYRNPQPPDNHTPARQISSREISSQQISVDAGRNEQSAPRDSKSEAIQPPQRLDTQDQARHSQQVPSGHTPVNQMRAIPANGGPAPHQRSRFSLMLDYVSGPGFSLSQVATAPTSGSNVPQNGHQDRVQAETSAGSQIRNSVANSVVVPSRLVENGSQLAGPLLQSKPAVDTTGIRLSTGNLLETDEVAQAKMDEVVSPPPVTQTPAIYAPMS